MKIKKILRKFEFTYIGFNIESILKKSAFIICGIAMIAFGAFNNIDISPAEGLVLDLALKFGGLAALIYGSIWFIKEWFQFFS